MTDIRDTRSHDAMPFTGPGAAAVLAAGIGSLAFGIVAFLADAVAPVNQALTIWPPSGALSGVSTAGIAIWLLAWFALARRWTTRDVALGPINVAAFLMLIGGLLLTFPPFMDLLQGK